jgi:hypothetical protein
VAKHTVPENVANMVRRAERNLRQDKDNARKYFKLYMRIPPKKRAKRSNLFIPKITSYVENAVARWHEAMFQYTPFFDLESRSAQNVQRADNAEKVLQYYLEQAHFQDKCSTWFKATAIENIGIVKLGWKKVVRKQKQRMSLSEAMTLPNFKLPKELEDVHAFIGPDEQPYIDESGVFLHEGDEMNEQTTALLDAGYRMVTLDQAPPDVQEPFTVVAEAPKVLYDGLEFTPIPFEDAFWDTDASSVDEMRFAGHHTGKTLADLKGEKKAGIPYKNLSELESWATTGGVPDIARYKRRADIGKSQEQGYSEHETLFRVTEFWHEQEGRLYTFVSTGESTGEYAHGIVIREEDFPYWHGELPYHYLPAAVVPFEIIGVGIAELAEHLNIEKNELRNILMDMKVMAMNPPWLYNENLVTDPSKFQNLTPGAQIGLDLPDNISLDTVTKQIVINPTVFQNAMLLERMIDQDLEESTGVSKTHQGVAISRRTTYSEQSMLANEGNFRFRLQIKVIDDRFKRIAKQAQKLLDQFCDPTIEVRVTGDEANPAFATADREDLSFEYDVYPASSSVESLANQISQAQQMIQAYSSIQNSPMMQYIKPEPFLREFFRKSGIKNVDRFILSEEEIRQLQAEQAQAQLRAGSQGQGPQGAGGQGQGTQTQQDPAMVEVMDENDLLMAGEMPPVLPEQNHQVHIEGHSELLRQLAETRGLTEETAMQDEDVIRIIDHMRQHEQLGGAPLEQIGA